MPAGVVRDQTPADGRAADPAHAPGRGAEAIGAAGSIRLLIAEPAQLPVGLGVVRQRANIDELLGTATAPAEVLGLDVPTDALVAAWAGDPIELVVPRRGGIVVRFGEEMPHEVDGGIVGRLRDRGWLAIDVRSLAEDPGRLAEAVTFACDALDGLLVATGGAAAPGGERPIVLLGFGDGIVEALAVLEHGQRRPTAVVVVSPPNADSVAVQRLDQTLGGAAVPVLHLRSAEAVGGTASIRDLVTRGGLEDRAAPVPGLTGWTYARRPAPGVAWLPMLVEPVVDWVDRAATGEDRTMMLGARSAAGP